MVLELGQSLGCHLVRVKSTRTCIRLPFMRTKPEEYTVFSTSELKKEILSYLDMRQRYGEVITDASPLVREQFDKRDQFTIAHPKRVKESALASKLTELAEAAGLRTTVQLEGRSTGSKYQE